MTNLAHEIDISERRNGTSNPTPIKVRKKVKVRYYVKWGNVFLFLLAILSILAMVFIIKAGLLADDVKTVEQQEQENAAIAAFYAKKEADEKFSIWQKEHNSTQEVKSKSVDSEDDTTVPSIISDTDMDMLVLAVQHETGLNPGYYPDEDFDLLQQAMASVIWNRIGKPGFADSLEDVLSQEGQFDGLLDDIKNIDGLANANQFNVNDSRTRKNCIAAINGELYNGEKILFERCSIDESSLWEAWRNMQSCYSKQLSLVYSFETSDGRWIMFAGLAS